MSIHRRNTYPRTAQARSAVIWNYRFATVLCLALPLSSASSQAVGRHPNRRYVDQSVPVTSSLRLGGARTTQPAALGDNPIATIGREDGPDAFIFGEIASVGTTPQGTVVVVDRKMQDVRLFDSGGRFLQRLGRPGQGPGEFRAPHSLLVTPNGEIWVADMQRRLTVFAPSVDGYRLARTVPTEIGIRTMCFLGDELVVNGISLSDPYAIRVLDESARPIRAFGRIYQSPNAFVNYQFTEGLVACDSSNDIIVYASPATVGEVRAYRRDGRAVWRTVLEDVRTHVISETEGGGVKVERSPNGAHSLVSLNVVPGVGILLQYGLRTAAQMAAKEPVGEILTIVLDPKTGAATLSSAWWPRLGAVSGNRAFALFDDLAPRIEIRELRNR